MHIQITAILANARQQAILIYNEEAIEAKTNCAYNQLCLFVYFDTLFFAEVKKVDGLGF
jgi:hypothetical protein